MKKSIGRLVNEGMLEHGSYVNYTPMYVEYTIPGSKTGVEYDQTIQSPNCSWRVWKVQSDGIWICSEPYAKVTLSGLRGYMEGPLALAIAVQCTVGNPKIGAYGRSFFVGDWNRMLGVSEGAPVQMAYFPAGEFHQFNYVQDGKNYKTGVCPAGSRFYDYAKSGIRAKELGYTMYYPTQSTPVCVTQTSYSYDKEPDGANRPYWLCESCVSTYSTMASYGVRKASSDYVGSDELVNSLGDYFANTNALRALVFLNSALKVVEGDGASQDSAFILADKTVRR